MKFRSYLLLKDMNIYALVTSGAWAWICSNACTGASPDRILQSHHTLDQGTVIYPQRTSFSNWNLFLPSDFATISFPTFSCVCLRRPGHVIVKNHSHLRVSHADVNLMEQLLGEPEDRLGSQSTKSVSRPNSGAASHCWLGPAEVRTAWTGWISIGTRLRIDQDDNDPAAF